MQSSARSNFEPRAIGELLSAKRPSPDRIFHYNIWFRGHNNARYAELLPRLRRVDSYIHHCSSRWPLRGAQFRCLRATRNMRYRLVLPFAARRYRFMFTTDNEQIPYFAGPIVADVDDPTFSASEVAGLKRSNVAYVVTAERAARRFQELGVQTPVYVIPQGFSLRSYCEADARRIGEQYRAPGSTVIGYVAAYFRSREDGAGADVFYDVDHLLDLWEQIRIAVPSAQLWLVGEPTRSVARRCRNRPDIVLFGRVNRSCLLSHIANFDIALYPRTVDAGISASKVAEYMGLGIPTVSYELEVTSILKETGAGLHARTAPEFVQAVSRLASDSDLRMSMSAAARRAGESFEWDNLAPRYAEILARHLT